MNSRRLAYANERRAFAIPLNCVNRGRLAAGVPACTGVARWHATSIYPASENSTGLMGSGRVRRHPHHRD
jgi:hypothetical protein